VPGAVAAAVTVGVESVSFGFGLDTMDGRSRRHRAGKQRSGPYSYVGTSEEPYAWPVLESAASVERELSDVSAAVGARLVELTQEIWRRITASMPELRDDDRIEKLLGSSVAENVTTVLHTLEHGTSIDNVDAPAAAHEYARRLAQR
jgi:hypothetical protein